VRRNGERPNGEKRRAGKRSGVRRNGGTPSGGRPSSGTASHRTPSGRKHQLDRPRRARPPRRGPKLGQWDRPRTACRRRKEPSPGRLPPPGRRLRRLAGLPYRPSQPNPHRPRLHRWKSVRRWNRVPAKAEVQECPRRVRPMAPRNRAGAVHSDRPPMSHPRRRAVGCWTIYSDRSAEKGRGFPPSRSRSF
jgi:hypothetical protein